MFNFQYGLPPAGFYEEEEAIRMSMIYGVSRIFARAIVFMQEQMLDDGIDQERIDQLRGILIRAYHRWQSESSEN